MNVTTEVRYGLRAVIEISINRSDSGVLLKDIAKAQGIPLKYLDSIISDLKRSALVVNYSGKSSGYILTKNPDDISVYDIYRAFKPELCLVNCTSPQNECKRIDVCTAKDFWSELSEVIIDKMKQTKLTQLNQVL